MENKIKCPYCKSEEIVKRGLSPTQNRGKQQRYKCNSCNKTFIQDMGFWKMKNNEAKITSGIDLYFSNLSSRKVRNHFRRHLEHNASHVTVLDWCRKYVLKVKKYTDSLPIQKLGGLQYCDETNIDCKNRNDNFWCSIDGITRFITATHYSLNQSTEEAKLFLQKIKEKGDVFSVTSDGLPAYQEAFRKVFGEEIIHKVINFQKTRKYNVKIETVFSKFKDRVHLFRGLKAIWSAPILLNGIVIQHNFIEEHTTLRDYPCERAGLKLDVGQNRWLGLINLSSL